MAYKITSFRLYPEAKHHPEYVTVFILRNKQAMYKFYKQMCSDTNTDPGESNFEARCTGHGREQDPNEINSILFTNESANELHIVTHELLHITISWFAKYELASDYEKGYHLCLKQEQEEDFCHMLSRLCIQFYNNLNYEKYNLLGEL